MKTIVDVPPNFGTWLRKFRYFEKNMTQNELILKSGLTRRTIINIESGQTKGHTEDTIKGLANALGMSIVEFVAGIEKLKTNRDPKVGKITDFNFLLESFTEIDDNIRHLIRSINETELISNLDILQNAYRDILLAQITQRFPSFMNPLSEFSIFLLKENTVQFILDSMPKENLIIQVEDDFKQINYLLEKEKLVIDNPELFWDCSCIPQDKFSKNHCRIHSKDIGFKIAKSFNQNVKIKYRDYEFLWQNLDALWPPSIDSFYMIENIINNTDFISNPNHSIKSILDIGTGTGFLGIILASQINDVEDLIVTDWTTSSYLYSSLNWFINSKIHPKNKNISFRFQVATNT
ncbi:MAG: helix-turn-helix domain-containing protein, partial [Candidatus Neomarinimicrobiota bacterium]